MEPGAGHSFGALRDGTPYLERRGALHIGSTGRLVQRVDVVDRAFAFANNCPIDSGDNHVPLCALLPFAALIVVPAAAAENRATGVMTDKGKLTMFEGQKFEGDSVEAIKDMPSISYDFTIGSIAVYPGEKWELCEQSRYLGVCNVFTGNETKLGRIKIQSVRLVKPPVAAAAPKAN